VVTVGTLSKDNDDDDDDDGSENIGKKKMNLRSFNFNRLYLDPLNKSNAVTFLKLPNKLFISLGGYLSVKSTIGPCLK